MRMKINLLRNINFLNKSKLFWDGYSQLGADLPPSKHGHTAHARAQSILRGGSPWRPMVAMTSNKFFIYLISGIDMSQIFLGCNGRGSKLSAKCPRFESKCSYGELKRRPHTIIKSNNHRSLRDSLFLHKTD